MSLPEDFAGAFVWEWHDGSFDRARFDLPPNGWEVTGRHGDSRYVLQINHDHAPISLAATCGDKTCSLRRSARGWRNEDDELLPGSERASDLDLGGTAETNSFTLRRLMTRRRSHGQFDVLMISLPDMTPHVVRQSYAREGDGAVWRYANQTSGFSARLTVDKNGLVTDYPDLCSKRD